MTIATAGGRTSFQPALAASRTGWLAVGALALLAPAIAIGVPAPLDDSSLYFEIGRWVLHFVGFPGSPDDDPSGYMNLLGARSLVYGAVLALAFAIGGVWGIPILNAALAAFVVQAAVRAMRAPRADMTAAAICAVIAVFSPGGASVAYLMPDVLAGIAIAAILTSITFGARLRPWENGAMAALAAFAAVSHASNAPPLLAAACAAIGGLMLIGRADRAAWRRTACMAATTMGAVAFGIGAMKAAEATIGLPAAAPPFISARLLADGPGRAYLRHVCPGAGYALCAHAEKPLDDSEDILWSGDPSEGVFVIAPEAEQFALASEQMRFAFGTLAYDPVGVVVSILGNGFTQFVRFGMGRDYSWGICGYLYGEDWQEYVLRPLLPQVSGFGGDFAACRALPLWRGLDVMGISGVALSAAIICGWAVRRRPWRNRPDAGGEDDRRLAIWIGALALALLANAFICGAISGPFGRYQARVVWLVPLAAGVIVARGLQLRALRSEGETS